MRFTRVIIGFTLGKFNLGGFVLTQSDPVFDRLWETVDVGSLGVATEHGF